MITEEQYIGYFSNLATQHKQLLHNSGEKDAFFYLPMPYDLAAIDNALRNTKSSPLIALDSLRGVFDSNQSENNVQSVDGQFFILVKTQTDKQSTIREAQALSLKIGLDFITRMKLDCRKRQMFDPLANFTISNVKYDPVGPMADKMYGYTFRFVISCPFGYTVDSGTWQDK